MNSEPFTSRKPLTISLHYQQYNTLYYCTYCIADNIKDSDVLLISKIIVCVFSEDSGAREKTWQYVCFDARLPSQSNIV